jgi:hypothetical protein
MDTNERVPVPQLQTFVWTHIYNNYICYSVNKYIVSIDECLDLLDCSAPVHDLQLFNHVCFKLFFFCWHIFRFTLFSTAGSMENKQK